MTYRLRMCALNAMEDADLSVSPAAESTLPVTNLLINKRARVWRSTSAAEQVISFDWNGSGFYLNHLALMRHNLGPAATRRWQLYSDAAWTTQVYDSGTDYAYDAATLGELDFGVDELGSSIFDGWGGQRNTVDYFTQVLALSGKLTITDTGNDAGYVQASHLWGGQYTELTYNAGGESNAWRDTAEIERSDGGSAQSGYGVAYRELMLDLPAIAAADRATLMDMLRYVGKRKPVFVSLYPEAGGEKERDYTLLGKFLNLPDLSMEGNRSNLWQSRLPITEI